MNFKLTEDLKDKVVEFYLSRPMSLDTVSYKFRICKPKIVEILKSRNIEIYTKNQIFNPNFDERYFQNIDSEIKAYFLGLIFTDGNVFIKENECSKKITQVSLTLKDEDRYILEILKKELKTNRVITSDNRGSLTLSVRSNLMGEDLKKYNIVPNKSLTIRFPEIDGNLKKYNEGYPKFWKKEHQIKIYANEFLPIGFNIKHKQDALLKYSEELLKVMKPNKTHQFYWEKTKRKSSKPHHPCENDVSLPSEIRGKHFDSWTDLARFLGYDK